MTTMMKKKSEHKLNSRSLEFALEYKKLNILCYEIKHIQLKPSRVFLLLSISGEIHQRYKPRNHLASLLPFCEKHFPLWLQYAFFLQILSCADFIILSWRDLGKLGSG